MKTNRNIKMLKQIAFFVLVGILITASSCKKDSTTTTTTVTFMATLNGASETPANSSMATGTATLTYTPSTKMFYIIVNFSGVTATAAHIHNGAVGVAGGVEFGFPSPVTSPITYTSVALTTAQEADLMANLYYVNVHSAAYPGGEIRGQLIKQ